MALINISDPASATVAAIAGVITSLLDFQGKVADKLTPEQVQRITDDVINLMDPFNSLVRGMDHKFGIATLDPTQAGGSK
jgi:hypothetical protein